MVERLSNPLSVVIFLVTRPDGKILLEERKEEFDEACGKIIIPAGKISKSETPQEALQRELLEELEISVRMYFGLGTITTDTGYLASVVLVTDYAGEIANKEGRNSHIWLMPEEADKVLGLGSDKAILKKAKVFLPQLTQVLEEQKTD